MKKKIFDKNLINSLSEQLNPKYMSVAYDYVCNSLDKALQTILNKKPIINDYRYEIVNECKNFAEGQNSTLDIFVEIKSPSLELYCFNTNQNSFKKALRRFSNAWKDSSKKKNTKHSKKNTYQVPTNDKYTMLSFKNELVGELAKYFSDETMLYVYDNSIYIYSKDELGVNVNLYIVFGMEDEFRLFNTKTYKLTEIYFKDREINFDKKTKSTNSRFVNILRILNGLYFQYSKKAINQLFIESILYNIPNELFIDDDIYNTLLKIINYININIANVINYKSILDESKSIYNEPIMNNCITSFIKFIKYIIELI